VGEFSPACKERNTLHRLDHFFLFSRSCARYLPWAMAATGANNNLSRPLRVRKKPGPSRFNAARAG
jgi:hypothetical protein